MKLKLDENLSRHLKEILSVLGHDIITAAEENLLGQQDSRIAEAARAEGRMLLTLDLEFGNIRKNPPGSHPGIVLFRPSSLGPLAVNRFVEEFIRQTDMDALAGCVVVAEPGRTRVRWPERGTETRV